MVTYDVIEILTNAPVYQNATYEECVIWIESYGNIIDYTISLH